VARPELQGLPTMSLIDRLSLDDGDNAGQGNITRMGIKINYRDAIKRYKDSVKRDIEWLFNTRTTFDERIADYAELSTSVYAFGLPDISSVNVGSVKDQNRLLLVMKKCLETFDRRLKDIEISFEQQEGGTRALKFRIDGIVVMDPQPEDISLDTVLDSIHGRYEVK